MISGEAGCLTSPFSPERKNDSVDATGQFVGIAASTSSSCLLVDETIGKARAAERAGTWRWVGMFGGALAGPRRGPETTPSGAVVGLSWRWCW